MAFKGNVLCGEIHLLCKAQHFGFDPVSIAVLICFQEYQNTFPRTAINPDRTGSSSIRAFQIRERFSEGCNLCLRAFSRLIDHLPAGCAGIGLHCRPKCFLVNGTDGENSVSRIQIGIAFSRDCNENGTYDLIVKKVEE